jgi:hypothetical protein
MPGEPAVLLQRAVLQERIAILHRAAEECFEAIETGKTAAAR